MFDWPTVRDMGKLFRRVLCVAWLVLSAKMLYCIVCEVAIQTPLGTSFALTTFLLFVVWLAEFELR